MSKASKKPGDDRRRRRPPIPCGPGAAPPATVPRETAGERILRVKFGVRDRIAAIVQDLRDVHADAVGSITSGPVLASLMSAEQDLKQVLNHLERPA